MKKYTFKNKKGAAIVEMALVSMVLIPITLYISFFSDVLHLRNKVDEMNYFTAWELTAYQLSNYEGDKEGAYKSSESAINNAMTDIKKRTAELYEKFDSADKDAPTPFFVMLTPFPIDENSSDFNLSKKTLKELYTNTNTNTEADNFFDKALGFLNKMGGSLSKLFLGNLFRFNTNNVAISSSIKIKFSMTEKLKTDNTNWGENKGMLSNTSMYDENLISAGGEYQAPEFVVLADTWALSDGSNVSPKKDQSINSPYRLQVQRMVFLGVPDLLDTSFLGAILEPLGTVLNKVMGALGANVCANSFSLTSWMGGIDPFCARVASVNHTKSHLGTIMKDTDGGQEKHYTAPVIYYNGEGKQIKDESEYFKTLQARDNYYMGNKTSQCHYTGLTDDNEQMKCEEY